MRLKNTKAFVCQWYASFYGWYDGTTFNHTLLYATGTNRY